MKNLFLLISLFCFATINAQSSRVKKDSLSTTELKTAQEMFVKMMQSEAYTKKEESMRNYLDKSNGIGLPPAFNDIQVMSKLTPDELKVVYKDWITENIQKTKFKTVQEGVDGYFENIALIEKIQAENADLYTLMRRANRTQLKVIREPELQKSFDRRYEKKRQ